MRLTPVLFVLGCAANSATPTVPTGAVTRAADAPARVAPSGKASITELARGESAFVGRLTMAPGASVAEHRDETEEYLYVLAGGGTIHIDGVATVIGPGDAVYMPANALVSYENGPEELVVVQVFAGPGPASKYDAWAPR
jgi:quercetin dioxygenase-like cupin family protein